jgi:hypothetical protein
VSHVVRLAFAASAATCICVLVLAFREMDDPHVLAHPQLFGWLTTVGFVALAGVTASFMYWVLRMSNDQSRSIADPNFEPRTKIELVASQSGSLA